MKWTYDRPTEPGLYLCPPEKVRYVDGLPVMADYDAAIVYRTDAGLRVKITDHDPGDPISWNVTDEDLAGFRWLGPLTPPEPDA
jgi:hypothetical protein